MSNFNKVTNIFCFVNEFCNNFDNYNKDFIRGNPSKRPAIMSKSEVITNTILSPVPALRTLTTP